MVKSEFFLNTDFSLEILLFLYTHSGINLCARCLLVIQAQPLRSSIFLSLKHQLRSGHMWEEQLLNSEKSFRSIEVNIKKQL
jgi:hypothetical protein